VFCRATFGGATSGISRKAGASIEARPGPLKSMSALRLSPYQGNWVWAAVADPITDQGLEGMMEGEGVQGKGEGGDLSLKTTTPVRNHTLQQCDPQSRLSAGTYVHAASGSANFLKEGISSNQDKLQNLFVFVRLLMIRPLSGGGGEVPPHLCSEPDRLAAQESARTCKTQPLLYKLF